MSSGVEFDEDKFGMGGAPQQVAPAPGPAAQPSFGAPPQFSQFQRATPVVVPKAPAAEPYYPPGYASQPKLNQWLMRHGIAKSTKSANVILLAVVVINIIITFVVVKFFL